MSLIRLLADQISPSKPRYLRQTGPHNCAQTVLAMALGVAPEAVASHLGTNSTVTVNQVLVLLARFGITTRPVAASPSTRYQPSVPPNGPHSTSTRTLLPETPSLPEQETLMSAGWSSRESRVSRGAFNGPFGWAWSSETEPGEPGSFRST